MFGEWSQELEFSVTVLTDLYEHQHCDENTGHKDTNVQWSQRC